MRVPLLSLALMLSGCASAASSGVEDCQRWFQDLDGDGVGNSSVEVQTCSDVSAPPAGLASEGGDCCDLDASVFPGQTLFFTEPQAACPDVDPFDYNCNGRADDQLNGRTGQGQFNSCNTYYPENCVGQVWGSDAKCGQFADVFTCGYSAGTCSGVRDNSGQLVRASVLVECN